MKSILTLCAAMLFVTAKSQNLPQQPDTSSMEFRTVLITAEFPGGEKAWIKYLRANLHTSIADKAIKLQKHQQDSIQTIIVSFLVDTLGNITDPKVINSDQVSPLLADEAIRVIAKGPRWKPAVQNGRLVIYKQHQAISFQVTRG